MAKNRRFRRGIYLLPTMFTVGNLLCGYSSMILTFRGEVAKAALLIIVAGVLDILDGRIARLTGTTSDFGKEFDTLTDIVSFGVAPALLAYQWTLHPFGRLGWLISFLFVICAAMRLARFNISHAGGKRHFVGLSSPVAAGSLACVAFAFPRPDPGGWQAVPPALLVAALALLMVSRFRYRSFKEIDLRDRRSYTYVLPLAVMMVAIGFFPRWSLLTISGLYLGSAPALYFWGLLRRVNGRQRTDPAREPEVVDEPALR